MGCSIDFKRQNSVRFALIWCECGIRLMENAQTWLKHLSVQIFCFLIFSFFGWACAAKTVLLGLIFDLWAVNQIWSPVPCEESICDTHKTECERTKMAGSVYRLWLYLSCLSMYHHILKLSLFVSKIIFIF